MVIKSYHIILAVKILGCFLLKWAGFGELLGWKSSTRSGNTVRSERVSQRGLCCLRSLITCCSGWRSPNIGLDLGLFLTSNNTNFDVNKIVQSTIKLFDVVIMLRFCYFL